MKILFMKVTSVVLALIVAYLVDIEYGSSYASSYILIYTVLIMISNSVSSAHEGYLIKSFGRNSSVGAIILVISIIVLLSSLFILFPLNIFNTGSLNNKFNELTSLLINQTLFFTFVGYLRIKYDSSTYIFYKELFPQFIIVLFLLFQMQNTNEGSTSIYMFTSLLYLFLVFILVFLSIFSYYYNDKGVESEKVLPDHKSFRYSNLLYVTVGFMMIQFLTRGEMILLKKSVPDVTYINYYYIIRICEFCLMPQLLFNMKISKRVAELDFTKLTKFEHYIRGNSSTIYFMFLISSLTVLVILFFLSRIDFIQFQTVLYVCALILIGKHFISTSYGPLFLFIKIFSVKKAVFIPSIIVVAGSFFSSYLLYLSGVQWEVYMVIVSCIFFLANYYRSYSAKKVVKRDFDLDLSL